MNLTCSNCGKDIKVSLSDAVALENLARIDGSPPIGVLCDDCEEL